MLSDAKTAPPEFCALFEEKYSRSMQHDETTPTCNSTARVCLDLNKVQDLSTVIHCTVYE